MLSPFSRRVHPLGVWQPGFFAKCGSQIRKYAAAVHVPAARYFSLAGKVPKRAFGGVNAPRNPVRPDSTPQHRPSSFSAFHKAWEGKASSLPRRRRESCRRFEGAAEMRRLLIFFHPGRMEGQTMEQENACRPIAAKRVGKFACGKFQGVA